MLLSELFVNEDRVKAGDCLSGRQLWWVWPAGVVLPEKVVVVVGGRRSERGREREFQLCRVLSLIDQSMSHLERRCDVSYGETVMGELPVRDETVFMLNWKVFDNG
ncbi:hypothetical protein L1987_74715 [Smallanthus sonchifolius]|uniref:Uncharacterized protein n=1 Tax=Smallanthus sonchifolius TaxID=185202 RepID=A0ACB9A3G1_9ASTR|nr:hypothetical protein L1987_74715 [Smallanthus sonchifolius]